MEILRDSILIAICEITEPMNSNLALKQCHRLDVLLSSTNPMLITLPLMIFFQCSEHNDCKIDTAKKK